MKSSQPQFSLWQEFVVMMIFSSILITLSACSTITAEPTALPVATAAPTSTASGVALTPNHKELALTRVAINDAARSTSIALTAEPTRTPGQPPPVATSTPLLGILPGCGNGKAPEPYYLTCWRGLIGTDYVDVEAGREGTSGDPGQGVLHVIVWHRSHHLYRTPQRVGAVRIASIDQLLFNLVSEDGQHAFIFDLATRQWVPPGPTLAPSLAPSPMP